MTLEHQEKPKNTEETIEKSTKSIIKKMTIEETREFIDKAFSMECDPKSIMKELGEDLLPPIKAGKKKITKKALDTLGRALMSLGLDTHYPLAESVNERYRPLAVEFSRQIIKEFNCINPSEKALAQTVVNAYIETIDCSRRFHRCIAASEYISDEKTRYLAIMSKQSDRANRQFITALTTLKQIKAPSFEINVKTKTAFVAQNQQLNINPNKDNSENNENIETK